MHAAAPAGPDTMLPQNTAFSFIPCNMREGKPRRRGVTEIRGPYYTPMGIRYLTDILETYGQYVDTLKFAGGSFTLMEERALRQITELCHAHDVKVSTGGFLERVLAYGGDQKALVHKYMETCGSVGFDILEVSTGFISLPTDDWIKLVQQAKDHGLKPKPEVGIQVGAGGASSVEALQSAGTRDVKNLVSQCSLFLKEGVDMIMIESEGITECVKEWRTDVISTIMTDVGMEHVMFEAAEPDVFSWYVKNYGPEVNLFVDHSQIVQLECLRRGIWGTTDTWGRVLTYKS